MILVVIVVVLVIVAIVIGVRNTSNESKYQGIHYYENFDGVWEFISHLSNMSNFAPSTNKRKKCNMYIDGRLYERTDTYYEMTQSSLSLWYGNEEIKLDLSKLKPYKLEDGTTSISSEIRKTRRGYEMTIRKASVIGSIDDEEVIIGVSEGDMSLYYKGYSYVILRYNSPTLPSEKDLAHSSLECLQADKDYWKLKRIKEDNNSICHYDNYTDMWKFITFMMQRQAYSLFTNGRDRCNLYINGHLYKETETHYKLTSSSFTLWFGEEEYHIDLTTLKIIKLKDGNTSMYTEKKTDKEDDYTYMYAFIMGQINESIVALYITCIISFYLDGKIFSICPYSSPVISSEKSIIDIEAGTLVDNMKKVTNTVDIELKTMFEEANNK